MLQVEHKGKLYILFDSIQVQTSLDNISGQYTLRTTLSTNLPFGKGSFIRILADGKYVVSGFIEGVKGNITKQSQDITMSGRDLLGDLVDSAVPDGARSTVGSITLFELCNKVINALGIRAKVDDSSVGYIAPFTTEELTSVEFGGKAGNFLQEYARKRQVFLTTFGNGYLVLFRPPTSVGYSGKLTEDSMLQRSFEYSDKDRFNSVTVGSEDNFASKDITTVDDLSVNRQGIAIDKTIRSTRVLQFQAEQSMNDSELKRRAEEEVNIRRARGFSYMCTVPSHQYQIGKLIRVKDELAGVSGVFLIRSIIYTANKEGDTSQLTLCFPESYNGNGERISEKKSKMESGPLIEPNPAARLRQERLVL